MGDWVEFLGCRIDLSKRPMAPRPETEYWVEQAITAIRNRVSKEPRNPVSVLDIFSGSGCIGIAVAKHCLNAHITFADKSPTMLEQIKINCANNELGIMNYELIQTEVFSGISKKYDFILANPPYVALGTGVGGIMDQEPPEALYAGHDGLTVIRPFLFQAREHLASSGQVWLEFGSEQKETVTDLLRTYNYYQNFNCTFHRDQHGAWRYVVIT